MIRKIRKVIKGKPVTEGAGVQLKRVFGYSEVPQFDPFLLLDDFRNDRPERFTKGFPWHPHRGIETITYVLEGDVEHGDSLGNKGVISSGDVQWMSAGSGIIHQEMPLGNEKGRMYGFQLWANLPASQKMSAPRYREIKSVDIPEVEIEGTKLRVIAGSIAGASGPAKEIAIEPLYADVTVHEKREVKLPVTKGHTVFAYVIGGEGYFCTEKQPFSYEVQQNRYFDMDSDPKISDGSLVLFDDGDEIVVSTEDTPIRFLLCAGKPLNEAVAWYGPIVMNTQEELQTAFEEYRNGTFIKNQDKSEP